MVGGQLHAFIRRLRRVVGPTPNDGPSDAQLLHRFVQGRDEEAFELLVWRHGAMVLNVCRRVLRREHDSEDAFQATFLTLVRKAATIGKRESLGSWLYKVAYRIALRAREVRPSRPLPEGPLPDPSSKEPIHDLAWREVGAALDEEIQRLPEKYRAALVLCHLEGQTIESAARTLDCPPGTVGTWLARARGLLRRRLARRGFDLSSVMEARNVAALLSAALVNATVRAAGCGSAEKAAAAGVISESVADLTKGALRAMTLTRWTTITVLVLTMSLLGGAVALLAPRLSALEPARAAGDPKRQPAEEKNMAPVGFQWKFRKGEPFYQVMKTATVQTLGFTNMEGVRSKDVTVKDEQTFYFQWTPVEEKDGKWVLTQRIVGVGIGGIRAGFVCGPDISFGPGPFKYDSTKEEDGKNQLAPFYQPLIGSEFKVTLGEDGKAHKIEGRDEVIKKLSASHPKTRGVLNQVLSQDALRRMADTAFAELPAKPVRPGDSWTKTSTLNLPPVGDFQTTWRYIYEKEKSKRDRIAVEGVTKYQPRKDGGAEGYYEVKRSAMKGKGMGAVLFDRAKGRAVRLELDLKLEGAVTFVISGRDTEMRMSQTQQTTVRTMDTNPIPIKTRPGEEEAEIKRLRAENERLRRRLQAVDDALRRDDKSK